MLQSVVEIDKVVNDCFHAINQLIRNVAQLRGILIYILEHTKRNYAKRLNLLAKLRVQ